ncbi:conserved hypothetical protein [Ricinus communis]|uniref:Uncharacterized protein n=1 Tax=Ricinus communis TaxID=3988 RepID=B9RWZ0_RICCO|nr:conserved hypothetical protein [Ricinus communis]
MSETGSLLDGVQLAETLGESFPTIFENGLVIHKDKESFLYVLLPALKPGERLA